MAEAEAHAAANPWPSPPWAMVTLNGIVQNVFDTPESTDRKTGEARTTAARIQVLAENILQNGQKRMDLLTLKVGEQVTVPCPLIGWAVLAPVGAFVPGSAVQFYALNAGVPDDAAALPGVTGPAAGGGRTDGQSNCPPARASPAEGCCGFRNGPELPDTCRYLPCS
jgi:hypothetical protein